MSSTVSFFEGGAFLGKPLNDEALIDAIRSALKRN
jgi:FixJ family two-component response regulator